MNETSGPFETEAQARALPAVRAVYNPFGGRMAAANQQVLVRACHDAGVQFGAYDRIIVAWLAGSEPQTCAVIAGLIRRAAQLETARQPAPAAMERAADLKIALAALEQAADDKRERAANCADCTDQTCGTCRYRMQTAAEYDHLASRLSVQLHGIPAPPPEIEAGR